MNQPYEYTADDFPTTCNKKIIEKGSNAGCLSCFNVFPKDKITNWFTDFEGGILPTAACPFCNQDTVIPDREGIKLDDEYMKAIIKAMFSN